MNGRDTKLPKRPPGVLGFVGMMGGIALLGGLLGIGATFLGDIPGALGFWLTVLVIGAGLCVAMVAAVLWWRGIDEAAREAHKWAWWWGGSGGMAVGGTLLLALNFRDDIGIELPTSEASDLLAAGMVVIILFQMVGYTLAWAAWWLRHR